MVKAIKIVTILALLFASCEGDSISKRLCFKMVVSDAIPIQFWVDGCETFNQKEIQGIYNVCFCQPRECGESIKIQITDSVITTFTLTLFDSDENLIAAIPFTGTNPVFSVEFTPEDYGICDEQIVLKINTSSGLIALAEAGTYDDFWSNDSAIGTVPWTIDAGNFYVIFGSMIYPGTVSNYAKRDIVGGGQYITMRHTIDITAAAGVRNYELKYEFYSASVLIGTLEKTYTAAASTSFNTTDSISGTIGPFDEIKIVVTHPEESFSEFMFESIYETSIYDILAQSDCIDIRTSWDETISITYSNNRNFAGIDNQDLSPDTDFNLRIPAVFFEEQFPQEQEVEELSDNREIQLNSQVKTQRLLSVGMMPAYMHKKTILALMHQFVEIDGRNWVKSDAYEKIDGNKRFPMKQYKCWLTQQDDIIRNIL